MGDFQTMLADLQRWHDYRDKRAFERFYRAYGPRAKRVVQRAIASRALRERYTDEIVQESMIRLLNDAKAADAESFAFWDRVVRWTFISTLRKVNALGKVKAEGPEEALDASPKPQAERDGPEILSGQADPEAEAAFANIERRGEYVLLQKALARVTPASRIAVALSLSRPLDVLTLQDRRELAASSGLTDAELETRLASHDPEDQDAVLALRFPAAERATPADRARCVDTLRVARARGVRQAAALIKLSAELKGGGK